MEENKKTYSSIAAAICYFCHTDVRVDTLADMISRRRIEIVDEKPTRKTASDDECSRQYSTPVQIHIFPTLCFVSWRWERKKFICAAIRSLILLFGWCRQGSDCILERAYKTIFDQTLVIEASNLAYPVSPFEYPLSRSYDRITNFMYESLPIYCAMPESISLCLEEVRSQKDALKGDRINEPSRSSQRHVPVLTSSCDISHRFSHPIFGSLPYVWWETWDYNCTSSHIG